MKVLIRPLPITLLIVQLFWLMLSGPSLAGEFSADTMVDRFGQQVPAHILVKGRLIRQEMKDGFGQEQVFIADLAAKSAFLLYPQSLSYMRMPAVAAVSPLGEDEDSLAKIGARTDLGQEWLNGYLCNRFDITFNNRYRGRMQVWEAVKLGYPIRMNQVDGSGPGFQRDLTNIREEPLSDDLFRLPAAYHEIKKPNQGFCGAGICAFSIY